MRDLSHPRCPHASVYGGICTDCGRNKRAENREKSAEVLRSHGVKFESKNNGAHLIVAVGQQVADLWPGTGKWKIRGAAEFRRGVFKLLIALGVKVKP